VSRRGDPRRVVCHLAITFVQTGRISDPGAMPASTRTRPRSPCPKPGPAGPSGWWRTSSCREGRTRPACGENALWTAIDTSILRDTAKTLLLQRAAVRLQRQGIAREPQGTGAGTPRPRMIRLVLLHFPRVPEDVRFSLVERMLSRRKRPDAGARAPRPFVFSPCMLTSPHTHTNLYLQSTVGITPRAPQRLNTWMSSSTEAIAARIIEKQFFDLPGVPPGIPLC
jgi:hypothetical protein